VLLEGMFTVFARGNDEAIFAPSFSQSDIYNTDCFVPRSDDYRFMPGNLPPIGMLFIIFIIDFI
jgi:hypothetical protein